MPAYMINLEDLIVGNITDCNFRITKSVLDCEPQKIVKMLGKEWKNRDPKLKIKINISYKIQECDSSVIVLLFTRSL